jgi:transcriptional regulator with XRE-family HTH domain
LSNEKYIAFVRSRITELRVKKDVSEHKMSLDLDKSGSYIRSITSGASMPSVKELFNISEYFGISPVDFFAPLSSEDAPYSTICKRLRSLDDSDLEKVSIFLDWITEQKY